MTTVCSTAVCGTGGWNGPLPGDPDNNSILTATAEFGGVQLSWTLPSTNAHAVAYTNIYRSIGDDFATAIPFTAVSGTGYFDFQAAKVIRQYFYWIQHVSVNGTVLDPIGPASATAMPQIDQVIAALTGRIESSALATALRERIDVITDLENGLTQVNTKVTTDNNVFAQELTALRNELTGALAYIDSQQTISINERQALVTSLNTQLAQFEDGMYAAIQDEATTRADETGDLFAQKTLKIDLAGNVAGYGLSARVDPTGEFTSDFQVRADTFSIAPPSLSSSTAPDNPYQGMVWVDTSVTPNVTKWYNNDTAAWQTTPVKGAVPFIVKTTPETIDGYTVPAGVYIDSAVITRLSANQIDTRGLIVRDLNGAPVIQMGSAIDWSKLGGSAPNLSGLGYSGALDATRNVFRGDWATAVDYKVGDVVAVGGSTWTARVDHTSADGTNNPPALPATSNTWWLLLAAKGDTGANAVAAVLSNEAHVFSAATDGTVDTYAGSGTDIRVYEGATELAYDGVGTANGTWKVTSVASGITVGTLTDSGTYLTVGTHTGMDAATNVATITYTVTGKTAAGIAFSVTKEQTFSKSKAGSTGAVGAQGPSVLVTPDRVTTFTATDGTLDAPQADIVFTASVSGVASPTYVWSFSDFQTAPINSGTATQTITAAQFGTAKSAIVTCTVSGTYTDKVTIVRLEKSTAAAGATVGAPAGTYVGSTLAQDVESTAGAQSKADAVLSSSLQKAGDAITGPVTFATNGGILAATDADNGVFMGPNGLVGKKAGATTFAVDTAGNASFGGALNAASGTFAGSLSAATGSFSGTLTAEAIDAVGTINIAGEAIITPRRGSIYKDYYQGGTSVTNVTVDLPTINFPTAGRAVIFVRVKFFEYSGNYSCDGRIRVMDGTTELYNTGPVTVDSYNGSPTWEKPMFTLDASMAAGDHTISLEFTSTSGSDAGTDSEITVMAIKK